MANAPSALARLFIATPGPPQAPGLSWWHSQWMSCSAVRAASTSSYTPPAPSRAAAVAGIESRLNRGDAAPRSGAGVPQAHLMRMHSSVQSLVSHAACAGGSGAEQALSERLSQFDGEAVLVETGVLKPLDPAALAALKALACDFLERERFTDLSLRQCTNVVSSMALLGQFHVPLNDAVVARALPELANAEPALAAALCFSLGTAGYSNMMFLKAVVGLLRRRHAEFDVVSLAKAVWMLGRVQHASPHVVELVDIVAQRALAPDAAPRDIVYALWATGAHQQYHEDLIDRCLQVVPAHIESLSGGELANLAWGLVQQDVGDTDLFERVAEAARDRLHCMFPRDVAKLVWALGEVNAGKAVMKGPLAEHLPRLLASFSRNELDMLMAAYNSWGLLDDTVGVLGAQIRVTHV